MVLGNHGPGGGGGPEVGSGGRWLQFAVQSYMTSSRNVYVCLGVSCWYGKPDSNLLPAVRSATRLVTKSGPHRTWLHRRRRKMPVIVRPALVRNRPAGRQCTMSQQGSFSLASQLICKCQSFVHQQASLDGLGVFGRLAKIGFSFPRRGLRSSAVPLLRLLRGYALV